MPIVIDKQINHHCRLGVWKITEDYPRLISALTPDEDDRYTLEGFKNPKRKLEWMSVRVLLNRLTGKNNKILYNGNRKPYLSDHSYNISISHSDQYSTVLLGKNKWVGVDIEKMQSKIEHIAFKFLQQRELQQISPHRRIYHLYLHWCAKEALYKLCDKKNLSFRQNMYIEPFEPQAEGFLYGQVETPEFQLRLTLYYFSIDNYSLVWCYM
ncbi:MAG: 4'-phosphopantetheinyl transferase superfamily protein [Bacteroidales bacterium]|nr:4'-phosphopantetheinyl transferase superfamily protein [Bacteroidales bacterium]